MTDVHNQSDVGNQFNASTLNNPVFHYGEKKIAKYLSILPVIPEVFIGRDEELRSVHDELFDGNNLLLLVNGEGGIGKTTLAAKYYQRYFSDYAHLGWVFAERSLGDALLTLADPLKMEFGQTDTADVRREKLLREMAGLQKPCLLVIDNANDLDDLSAHYHELRKCPNFHILLTTRIESFAHAKTCRVGHLDEASAIQLFTTHYPGHNAAEDALLKELLRAVGYNTLVIELLAKNLRILNEYRTGYPLAQMLDDLRHRGLFGLSKSDKVQTEYNPGSFRLREEKPETVIAAMYDLAKLEPGQERLLCVFSVLPAEPIAFDTLEALQPGNDELEKSLRSLVKKGWIEYNAGAKQFKCSPVVQAVTRLQIGDRLFEQCETLVYMLNKKLKFEPSTGHLINADYQMGRICSRYAESVIMCFSNKLMVTSILLDHIGNFYSTTGNLEKALTCFENGLDISEKLFYLSRKNNESKYGLVVSHSRLGYIYRELGKIDKALFLIKKAIALLEEIYKDNQGNIELEYSLAALRCELGDTHNVLSNRAEAFICFGEAMELYKKLHKTEPRDIKFTIGLATSYSKIGETYLAQGDLKNALRFFKQRSNLTKELYDVDPKDIKLRHGLAMSYCKLGETYMALSDFLMAKKYFELYFALMLDLHSSYQENVHFTHGLALSYERLWSVHSILGDQVNAFNCYEKRLELGDLLMRMSPDNLAYKNGLAISFANLGEFSLKHRGDKPQARMWFEQAEKLWGELVKDSPEYAEYQNNWSRVKETLAAL
jgi:tetratricopeptide (TPR) repeat protein